MTITLNDNSFSWPLRCSQFNHGWLRNRFCQALKATIQFARGKVGRDGYGDTTHVRLLKDWGEHQETAATLVSDFPDQMSPALLFAYPPLCNLDSEVALFFRDMAHSHWLQRHHIKNRLETAKDALESANALVHKLSDAKNTQDAVNSGLVEEIHASCLRLADALSQLPRAIKL
jgi:hypothetical protein